MTPAHCIDSSHRDATPSRTAFGVLVALLWSLLLCGCSWLPLAPGRPAGGDLASAAARYLEAHLLKPAFDGQVFCATELLNVDQQGRAIKAYVWAMCIEYYEENQILQAGTGASKPLLVYMIEYQGTPLVSGFAEPRDGSLFAEDIERIFPAEAVESMCLEDTPCKNARSARLQASIEELVKQTNNLPLATSTGE